MRLALRTRRLFLAVFLAVFFGGLAVGGWLIFGHPGGNGSGAFRTWILLWVVALTLSGLGLGFRRP